MGLCEEDEGGGGWVLEDFDVLVGEGEVWRMRRSGYDSIGDLRKDLNLHLVGKGRECRLPKAARGISRSWGVRRNKEPDKHESASGPNKPWMKLERYRPSVFKVQSLRSNLRYVALHCTEMTHSSTS